MTAGIVATAEAAAAADAHPPLATLMELQEAALPQAQAGDCVAYWMRMEDLRGTSLQDTSNASRGQHCTFPRLSHGSG